MNRMMAIVKLIYRWINDHRIFRCYDCKQWHIGHPTILYKVRDDGTMMPYPPIFDNRTLQGTLWCNKCYEDTWVTTCIECGCKVSVFAGYQLSAPYSIHDYVCPDCNEVEVKHADDENAKYAAFLSEEDDSFKEVNK
jgi:hypothetical protein